jgi:hypothetical protein
MSYITYQLALARLDDLRREARAAHRSDRLGELSGQTRLRGLRGRRRRLRARRHAYA